MSIKNKIWCGLAPKQCDICSEAIKEVFIDGKVRGAGWACMCEKCHANMGCGLGQGFGQKYKKEGNDFVKVEG